MKSMTADQSCKHAEGASIRKARSPEEVGNMLHHVGYELTSCVEHAVVRERLMDARVEELDPLTAVVANALLEACLVHARNLIELLAPPKRTPRADDVLIEDFTPGAWTPAPKSPAHRAASRCKSAHWALINKHLAHLTWTRVQRPDPPGWTLTSIASDVLVLCEAWRDHLRAAGESDLADALGRDIGQARTVLPDVVGTVSTTTGSSRPN